MMGMSGYSEGGAEVGGAARFLSREGRAGVLNSTCGLYGAVGAVLQVSMYRRRHRGTWASLHICARFPNKV